ncbi:MAG: GEVED domain-containing protein [Bacteroidetes bacterium]|nr:GEVED domain-containing protein [Bacteroidota bacterium]
MERKTTKFKYLLLIPALFLGLSLFAQKTEPVKKAPGSSTEVTTPSVSNHRPANWQMEQELQSALDNDNSSSNLPKSKVNQGLNNPQATAAYEKMKKNYADKMERERILSIPSAGLAPANLFPQVAVTEKPNNSKLPGDIAYGWVAYDGSGANPNGPMHFVLNNPSAVTSIASSSISTYGGTWALGNWYGVSTASDLFIIDPVTGATTIVGPCGAVVQDIAFDWTTNTMYGLSSGANFYTVDILTGAATLLGNIGSGLFVNIACDQNGVLFATDIIADNLWTINKTTAVGTIIGSIGFNANYAQDMEFDNSDNTMYMAAFNLTTFQGELRTVDVTSGATTMVGTFPGNPMEVTTLGIQNQPLVTYDNDMGVTSLIAPVNAGTLGNSELISCNVKNWGNNPQSGIPIQYTLDGLAPVPDVIPGPVLPGQTVQFDFAVHGDFSVYGNHTLVICVMLPGDQQSNNDCKTYTVVKIMPTWTDTIRPMLLPGWTGSTNGSIFTENSLIQIKSGQIEDGYAKFDLSNIPNNAPISMLKLGYYMQAQSGAPYLDFRRVNLDPMASSASATLTAIETGTLYLETTSGYSVGWHVFDLPAIARTHFSLATLQDWFCIGFYEFETYTGYVGTIEGWAQPHIPYLVVTYGYIPGPNDVGVLSLTSPVSAVSLNDHETVSCIVKNYGSADQNTAFNMSYKLNNNTPVVQSFTTPMPFFSNTQAPFSFTTVADMHSYGIYTLRVCTELPGDAFVNNDCKNYFITNILPTVTDTFYPGNAPYWTGTTNGTAFTENSLIRWTSGSIDDGWAKFDITAMANNVTVNSLSLHYYVQSSYIPYFSFTRMLVDPMTGTAAQVFANITGGAAYLSTTSGYNVGWNAFDLPAQAMTDLSDQTNFDWFAVGFYEYESGGSYTATAHGWAETNKPYIVANYAVPIPHDIAVVSINTPPYIVQGPFVPTVTVKNLGTNVETFTLTLTAPGYTHDTIIQVINVGEMMIIPFYGWTATAGIASMTACSSLPSDLNFMNNCVSKQLTVEAHLTQAYAFNAYDPSGVLPLGPCKFFLEHPENIQSIAPSVATEFISAGCWADGVWYVAEYSYSDNSNLWTCNPTTGVMTLIGPMGANIAGLTYDHTTNTLYAMSTYTGALSAWYCDLYTVNMATGAMTIKNHLGAMGLGINLACSQTGMLFFAETTNDRLWSFDPIANKGELMGTLSINLNYAQDAEFEKYSNQLYFAGYVSTGTLYKVNTATGACTAVGNFQGGAELCGFAIPYTYVKQPIDLGVMWITYPTIGNLTTEEPVIIRVRNYGLNTVDSLDLHFTYAGIQHDESWSTFGYPPIDPDMYFDYPFIDIIDLHEPGSHCITTWIDNVVGDNNQTNDTVAKCVNNTSCNTFGSCFANSIDEPEICGDDQDGGCNSTPEAYVNVMNGESYCGTMWKIDTLRDTDWYRFSLASTKGLRINAKAELNMDLYLMKLPCSDQTVIYSKTFTKCVLDSAVFTAVPAGEYAIVFVPNWLDFNTACNNNARYTFSFEVRPAKYCPAGSSYPNCDEHITNVTVGTINNSSACSQPGGYGNYTALSTIMEVGAIYPITCSISPYYSGDQMAVWVDWNQDFDVEDAGEKYSLISAGSSPFTGSIGVPPNALPGPTRMRVRLTYSGEVLPCGITYYGEVEDYSVFCSAPIPPIITTVGSLNEACPGTKIVPVTVQEFNSVNGLNLVLGMGTGITFLGYTDVNPALTEGTMSVIPAGNNLQMNWFSITPATIGTGLLLNLVFQTTAGTNPLVWDQGNCQYSSLVTGILPASYVDGQLVFGNCSNLDGFVIYKHVPVTNPKLRDSTAVSLYQGGVAIYTDSTDNTGYHFTNVANGTYTLKVSSGKKWVSAANATDALAILKHFVGLQLLTGLNLTAADVNGTGGVPNAADALAVARRFVGQINNFYPPSVPPPGGPDWYFENFTITIDGTANQIQDIKALAAGDVNGSWIPLNPGYKMSPSVYLTQEGSMYIDNTVIDVPVYAVNAMTVGAVSLVLSYPENLEIVGVSVANTPENLVYTASNGKLRLAWFSTNAVNVKAGEILLTLKVKATSLSNSDMIFTTNEESTLADNAAQTIENASLMMPKLVTQSGTMEYSLNNYPNPFNGTTEIRYSIPQNGFVTVKVYNVLGDEVATIVNADQKAGNYVVSFDGNNLPKGVYVYKLQVNDVTKARTMIITE